jgi:hypothetical protein
MFQYLNISYTQPYAFIHNPIGLILEGVTDSDVSLSQGFYNAFEEAIKPWTSEELVTQAAFDIARNKTNDGTAVYNEEGDFDSIAIDIALHAANAMSPGAIEKGIAIGRAATNTQGEKGKHYSLAIELISLLTGQRITTLDHKTSLKFAAYDISRRDIKASKIFTDKLYAAGVVDDTVFEDKFREMLRSRDRIAADLSRKAFATIGLGETPESVFDIATSAGIGQDRMRDVLAGRTTPWRPAASAEARILTIPGRMEQFERIAKKVLIERGELDAEE